MSRNQSNPKNQIPMLTRPMIRRTTVEYKRTGWIATVMLICVALALVVPARAQLRQDNARAAAEQKALANAKEHIASGKPVDHIDDAYISLGPCRGTLLHVAAFNGHRAVVEYLIGKGANVNHDDFMIKGPSEAATPLALAARQGHMDIVKLLGKP